MRASNFRKHGAKSSNIEPSRAHRCARARYAAPIWLTSLILVPMLLCMGCGSDVSGSQQEGVSTNPTGYAQVVEAEGYEILGGTWEVAAITYEDKIVPISSTEALADMYDTTFLGFSKDGSFEYRRNVYITRGSYIPYEGKDGSFILQGATSSRATIEDGKITETQAEPSSVAYLVVTTEDSENVLGFVEFDTDARSMKAGSSPLYFTKRGTSSSSSDTSETDANVGSSGSVGSSSSDELSYDRGSSSGSSSSSTSYGIGNQKAVQRAQQYLQTMAFSHDGLVEQLEYEGFSHEDATYGADACGADWKEQAALKAKQYLQANSFSERGLVQQLEYEGFSQAEAEYGVSLCGADWMEQAVMKARQYQSFSSMSRSRLIEQLEYEGFTHQQAVYGADNA